MLRFLITLLFPFGRSPRWQFWLVLILALALFVPVSGLPLAYANVPVPDLIGGLNNIIPGGFFGAAAIAAVGLYLLIIAFATRLHDRGRTGFWVFVMVLPLVAIGGLIYLQANPSLVPGVTPDMLLAIDTVNKVLGGLAGVLFLWLLLASMFFPGTRGRNWFGRDPSGDEVEKADAGHHHKATA
jgi:uncharacterized membrane protein YhaH (DUF805 family)